IAQALPLSVVLWTTRHGYRPANRLLAAMMLTIGLEIMISQLSRGTYVLRFPHVIRLSHPLDFVPGPLLYLYVRVLTDRRQLRRREVLHFVPAIACAVYLLPYYFHSAGLQTCRPQLAGVRELVLRPDRSSDCDWWMLRRGWIEARPEESKRGSPIAVCEY